MQRFLPVAFLLLPLASRAQAQDLPKLPRALDVSVPAKSAPETASTPATADHDDRTAAAARVALPQAVDGRPTSPDRRPEDAVRAVLAADVGRLEVVVDEIDGEPWCAADSYKARFTPAGPEFFPYLGADADRHHPVAFTLEGMTIAGRQAPLRPSAARLVDRTVSYERGPATELYALRPEGIEQMFRFDTLPERGAIEIRVGVHTGLEPRAEGRGFVFEGPRGGVVYGAAVAIDATGERVEVESRLDDGALTLTVPAEFVGRAKLPLLIDPLIGTRWFGENVLDVLRETDVAFDATLGSYVVVVERVFSATDSDVYAYRLDESLNPVGARFAFDITTTSWSRCRIAGLNAYDRFLCVAEVSAANSSPFWIGGRIYAPTETTSLLAPIEIAKAGIVGHAIGDKRNPDVGGDPSLVPPTYFTVVFERAFSANDHDICMKQVTQGGALRNASPTWIDNGSSFDTSPEISKSNGVMPFSSQRWGVVFHRRNPGTSISGHLRVATLAWDGQLQPMGMGVHEGITGSYPLGAGRFDISSPTDGGAGPRFLVAETRRDTSGRTDVVGTLCTDQGSVVGTGTFTASRSGSCREPAVDSDGVRFALTYVAESAPAPGLDEDVWIQTIGAVGSQLVIQDEQLVAGGARVENAPAIVANRSGGGQRLGYASTFVLDVGGGTHRVAVQRYEGAGNGGLTLRPTGCGLTVQAFGSSAIGEAFVLTLLQGSGTRGFVVGLPASLPLPCAQCSLGTTGFASFLQPTVQIDVPQDASLVGAVASFQGFAVGSGTCLGGIALSDTVDAQIR